MAELKNMDEQPTWYSNILTFNYIWTLEQKSQSSKWRSTYKHSTEQGSRGEQNTGERLEGERVWGLRWMTVPLRGVMC